MLLGNLAQSGRLALTSARKQDVDLALFPFDRIEQTVEVVEIGRVAAHAGHVPANQFDGLIERLLPPARDENVGALFNEPLGARQRPAARSTRDDCNFSFKLSHNCSLHSHVAWMPPQLPAGLPSALLERRPDIREAEQDLVAANANIGVAKAMFFPQISLLGSGGAAFGHSQFAGAHIPAPLGVGTYAASASQPIFEGGALRNNLRYAKSEERQALLGHQQTIQHAFGDVSDTLIGYDKNRAVRERQEQSVKDLRESVNVSLLRYRGGTSNYIDVLDSQRSLFSAELTLAQARNNEYQSLIQLYKALGGGWK